MKNVKVVMMILLAVYCFSAVLVNAQVVWDFEDGNDHGFTLWSVYEAKPASDDPETAGDEALTGVGGSDGLPESGLAWSIGQPDQYAGLKPAVVEGDHVHGGVLEYTDDNDPFGYFDVDPNSFVNPRGQTSYLNTYNLSMWGDDLHVKENDQIATSPPVVLGENAQLKVWCYGGGSRGVTTAPELEPDRETDGYWDQSCGVAVLSAVDYSFLASVYTQKYRVYGPDSLDLSDFAGQEVIIDVVDAFQGAWGWVAFDEISITNATLAGGSPVDSKSLVSGQFELVQNYPNPFNPTTKIEFSISRNMQVSLEVYNVQGQFIESVVNEKLSAGSYHYTFNAQDLPAGVYYYKLQSGEEVQTRKMVLMK